MVACFSIRRLLLPALVGPTVVTAALIALSSPHLGSDSVTEAHPPSGCAPGSDCTIDIGDLWFCDSDHQIDRTPPDDPCEVTVQVDDTVTWRQIGFLPHTTTECGDILPSEPCPPSRRWDSGTLLGGLTTTFPVTFTEADAGKTFLYRCDIHRIQMRGSVTVLAAPEPPSETQPPPSPTSTPKQEPTDTPAPEASATPADGQTPPPAAETPTAVLPATVAPNELPQGGSFTGAQDTSYIRPGVAAGLALVGIAAALFLLTARSRPGGGN